ncbi:MAG: HAD family hydrolase [Pseudomonadota bacterium]
MIRAVLFDLDETLHDRTSSLRAFLTDQFTRHSRLQRVECDDFIDKFLTLDERGRASKAVVYPNLLKALGILEDETERKSLGETLFGEFDNGFHRFAHAFPGVDDLLAALRRQDIKSGIVTNGRTEHQKLKLRALNLPQRVDAILISQAEDVWKPDREIFERAAARLGVTADECVFVGDSPLYDISGAARAGMRPIWFPNGSVWPDNLPRVDCPEIAHIDEVLPLVDRMSSAG